MAAYQLTAGTAIVRRADGAIIPADPRNADYRAYQAWVAAGNTPDPVSTASRPTTITFNQLMNRFTGPEQAALATAAQSNAQIFMWMVMGAGSNAINLLDSSVQAGVQALVPTVLATSGRATEVLTP